MTLTNPESMFLAYCPNCKWQAPLNTACKPFCPLCPGEYRLVVAMGTEEELRMVSREEIQECKECGALGSQAHIPDCAIGHPAAVCLALRMEEALGPFFLDMNEKDETIELALKFILRGWIDPSFDFHNLK
jgi:hypothetical protein